MNLFCSLGQIASMAGIDGSDFQPFERPQLSSTVGPHLEDAAFLSRDVQTNSDAAPLVRMFELLL